MVILVETRVSEPKGSLHSIISFDVFHILILISISRRRQHKQTNCNGHCKNSAAICIRKMPLINPTSFAKINA